MAAASPCAARRLPSLVVLAALASLAATVVAGPNVPSTSRPSGPATTAAASLTDIDPAVRLTLAEASVVDVVVQAAPGRATHVAEIVRATGGTVTRPLPIVDGFAATIDAAVLATLETTPGVRAVSLDHDIRVAGAATSAGESRFVEVVRADRLHAQGHDGAGVGIAVIDTGVSEVADLSGRLVGAIDLTADGDHRDRYGHGTFIAGIAAGDGTSSRGEHAGVAPGAHVVPVKIAGADGSSDVSHVLAAMQYVVSMADRYDIGVLNLSLGTDSTQPYRLSPLNHAVERVWDAGIVVVVSAGNHGERGPGHIPKPADDPLVITVGATDTQGTKRLRDDTIAPFSSIGPSLADGIAKPDLVAPGTSLVGTAAPGSRAVTENPGSVVDGAYLRGTGTSFAAAVVSGAVAVLRQAHPAWTPDQIKGALLATARPGPVGDPDVEGAGHLDVAAAAALTTPVAANQDVPRSSGLGSLARDRGTLALDVDADVDVEVGPGEPLRIDATTEVTAQGLAFDPLAWVTTGWTNTSWYATDWANTSWYATSWTNTSWYATDTYNTSWYEAAWR